jgi:hypothetical protein
VQRAVGIEVRAYVERLPMQLPGLCGGRIGRANTG